jgi:hypothetical protein
MQWFRFYNEALDDPKIQKLDGETFKAWINLLCLCARNDGLPHSVNDIAFALRLDFHGCSTVLSRLADGGLLDRLNGGANGMHYGVHGWDKRQYKSDTSTDRVKRFRQRSSNATETVIETAPETDTDTDTDKSNSYKRTALATRLPDDWNPSNEDIEFANQTGVDWIKNAEIFRDYWLAQPGVKGRKANWSATWRNWVRRASEQRVTRPQSKETAIEMGIRLIREIQDEPHTGNTIDHHDFISLPRQ